MSDPLPSSPPYPTTSPISEHKKTPTKELKKRKRTKRKPDRSNLQPSKKKGIFKKAKGKLRSLKGNGAKQHHRSRDTLAQWAKSTCELGNLILERLPFWKRTLVKGVMFTQLAMTSFPELDNVDEAIATAEKLLLQMASQFGEIDPSISGIATQLFDELASE